MSSAGVGCSSRGCCGTLWVCQVGVRTYLRSHQAPPEEMSLPLNDHLTGDLSGTNPICFFYLKSTTQPHESSPGRQSFP
eukprot:scaffold43115_cov63-Phaeocystis_antarctica.AAC.2